MNEDNWVKLKKTNAMLRGASTTRSISLRCLNILSTEKKYILRLGCSKTKKPSHPNPCYKHIQTVVPPHSRHLCIDLTELNLTHQQSTSFLWAPPAPPPPRHPPAPKGFVFVWRLKGLCFGATWAHVEHSNQHTYSFFLANFQNSNNRKRKNIPRPALKRIERKHNRSIFVSSRFLLVSKLGMYSNCSVRYRLKKVRAIVRWSIYRKKNVSIKMQLSDLARPDFKQTDS